MTTSNGNIPIHTMDKISLELKDTPEQKNVVGPLVCYLVQIGWDLEQILFGKKRMEST